MYTARDALKFAYIHLSQHGSTAKLGSNQFLFLLNSALNFIHNYQGYLRTWQHTSDAFVVKPGNVVHLLATTYPINTVDKFRVGRMMGKVGGPKTMTAIDCTTCSPEQPEEVCLPCDCCMNDTCEPLQLQRVLPNNKLCPGEYQIAGSEMKGVGGIYGSVIRVYPNCPVEAIWVSYYRGPKHIKSFDEPLLIPDGFIHVIGLIIAAQAIPLYGLMLAQQELNYRSLVRKELDYLKAADNVFASQMKYDENYPVFEKKANYGYARMN